MAPSTTRFEHLVTQMKWRLQEGAGEAIYEIGVEDSGIYIGLRRNELKVSMDTLRDMAKRYDTFIQQNQTWSLQFFITAAQNTSY